MPQPSPNCDRELAQILDEHGAHTMAVGVLRGGELVWSGTYGEQEPGWVADGTSLFNTASVSKAITTEAVLALVADGRVSLDEPLADYWVDPDVAGDPRHKLLTPRIVLAHRTGFPNWRYMADDGKLRFEAEPGAEFGYSGEGMQYLKRFVEVKLGRAFEEIVDELVFAPLGMDSSSVVAREWMDGRIVVPRSAEDGSPVDPNANPPGSANAADDLFTTVEDYAKLLATLFEDNQSPTELYLEKTTLQSDAADDDSWRCVPTERFLCPTRQGFGLGWLVFSWGDEKIVWHGGNDALEHAIGYINPSTGDGAIVFVNGATGIFAMLDALDVIDDHPPIVSFYRVLLGSAASE